MKKGLVLVLCITVCWVTGCKKDSNANLSADSYLPLTQGSLWKYSYQTNGGTTDTITISMTGGSTQINGKTYYNASSVYKGGNSLGYFYVGNHIYATRTIDNGSGSAMEFQLLNDIAPVGYQWITSPTDNGKVGSVPARTVNTIKEKNITRQLNGRTFTDVTHTQVELQYDFGSGFETSITYDFYLAKGIGLIENDANTLNTLVETETLFDYTIK
jgi:hypothetical protein